MIQTSNYESLEELEEDLCALLERRKELIEEQGGLERYFVYNDRDKCIAYDAWVLSARSSTDKSILQRISDGNDYARSWRTHIKKWLEDQEVRSIDLSDVEDIE